MTTYNELISRFEVYDNPPCKKGFDRHHIVPKSEQKRLYGSVTDERQIYVTPAQHLWAHVLYDREHGTKTAKKFLDICGKSVEFFTCYELCLAYSYTLRKKKEERDKKVAEVMKTDEYRKKLSDSLKGICRSEETKQKIAERTREAMNKPEVRRKCAEDKKGRKWFNDGIRNVFVHECPSEGFVEGMLKRSAV